MAPNHRGTNKGPALDALLRQTKLHRSPRRRGTGALQVLIKAPMAVSDLEGLRLPEGANAQQRTMFAPITRASQATPLQPIAEPHGGTAAGSDLRADRRE